MRLINEQDVFDIIDDLRDRMTVEGYCAMVERVKALATNLQQTCNQLATDCISRAAAIDIERNATVDTNPSHFEAHQKFTQFMDDAEVSSFGRWQWANGFNTALTAVGIDLKKLPSAQPEERTEERTETHACDLIDRQAAIDAERR